MCVLIAAPASRFPYGLLGLPASEVTTRPNAKAEGHARRVDPDPGPVVARIVAVVVTAVVAVAEAAVMWPEAVVPPTGSAVHLVDDGTVRDGALHALCSGKPDGSGRLR